MSALPFRVKEMEEKIVIPPERYFIVDCPTLHLIAAEHVEPRRHQISSGLWVFDRAFCPQCRQVITKARQIPSACFTVDDYADGSTATAITQITVPSPVPTPVPSPGIPGLRSARYDGRAESILSTPSNSSASPPPRWSAPLPVIEDVPIPEFRPYSPDLPEVVPSQEKQVEDQSNRGPSTFGKSSKLGHFFKRSSVGRDKPEKPAKPERPKGSSKSVSSHDSVSSTLPKIMSFCFSATGKNLLLWKKESEVLVRIELDTFGGRAIDLGDLLPEVEGERVVHIRHVVEGNEVLAVILSHNHGTMLLVLHESGLASHASLRPLEARQIPTCLAISPDNEYVAVGLGIHVLLLRYSGFNLQSGVTLTVPDFTSPSHIKFQTCSFAPDSSCLVVSTQRNDPRRSTDDDAVYTYVWPCQQVPGDPTRLWMCKMPTDGQGLTTVQFLPSLSLGFITGLTPTPYHLFLSPASQQLPQTPSKILEYRIRCSCFCPAPYNHILYFMDVKNKIHKVDMRTRRIQQVADVNTNRGALRPSEEHAILGATADGHLRVFWRQGAGLWALEVREGSSSTKRNLRPVWLDAMGG